MNSKIIISTFQSPRNRVIVPNDVEEREWPVSEYFGFNPLEIGS